MILKKLDEIHDDVRDMKRQINENKRNIETIKAVLLKKREKLPIPTPPPVTTPQPLFNTHQPLLNTSQPHSTTSINGDFGSLVYEPFSYRDILFSGDKDVERSTELVTELTTNTELITVTGNGQMARNMELETETGKGQIAKKKKKEKKK